jgi:hypothetical protein
MRVLNAIVAMILVVLFLLLQPVGLLVRWFADPLRTRRSGRESYLRRSPSARSLGSDGGA